MSTETQPEQTQEQQIGLSLNELAALANIINVASQRGAFKAAEMSAVGAVYDKLNAFVSAAQAAMQGSQEATQPAAEQSSEEVTNG